jgi:hypothetical protein
MVTAWHAAAGSLGNGAWKEPRENVAAENRGMGREMVERLVYVYNLPPWNVFLSGSKDH